MRLLFILILAVTSISCGTENRKPEENLDLEKADWSRIEKAARGRTITMGMWMGDPLINQYMREYVAGNLRERYDINLEIVAAQGGQIVSALLTEKEAGKTDTTYDILWINGETFYQLRAIDALYGPYTDTLPNAELIDFENPFISIDFQQPIDGYECPWGNVQLALIYDSERVEQPPMTRQALLEWVQAHPGRFTFDSSFTGMTLLKSWLIDIAGGKDALSGPFDEEKYLTYAAQLWDYINSLKPYLWREGKSFPSGVAQIHQMFANGELDFTMSNNDAEVDNKVIQGIFPESARAYVPTYGTIRNSHYLGIPAGSTQKSAALVAVNFLISPEAQLRKMDPNVWGDGTILDVARLPEDMRQAFSNLPNRERAPSRQSIEAFALMEPAPEYMIRIFADFRKHILNE